MTCRSAGSTDERVHRARAGPASTGAPSSGPIGSRLKNISARSAARTYRRIRAFTPAGRADLAAPRNATDRGAPAAGSSSALPAPPACCLSASTACACSCSGSSSPVCPRRSSGCAGINAPASGSTMVPSGSMCVRGDSVSRPCMRGSRSPSLSAMKAWPNSWTDTATTNATSESSATRTWSAEISSAGDYRIGPQTVSVTPWACRARRGRPPARRPPCLARTAP